MESDRFDILTRHLAAARGRRQAIATLAASALLLFRGTDPDEVSAKCKGYKRKCKKNASCCDGVGLECRRDRCRCKKKGWKRCPGSGSDCTHVKADPDNCGACGNACPPATPCCISGSCQEMCGGSCCAGCFMDFLNGVIPQPATATCCGPGSGTICSSKKHDTSDDECCWSDQECVNGECCCDGCLGAVICGGECCAGAACCNGECCPDGQVCAPDGLTCVSANRECGDCLPGEICHDGVCCSGDRICGDGQGNDVCCDFGEWCDDELGGDNISCCAINTQCHSTWRGHRVRK